MRANNASLDGVAVPKHTTSLVVSVLGDTNNTVGSPSKRVSSRFSETARFRSKYKPDNQLDLFPCSIENQLLWS